MKRYILSLVALCSALYASADPIGKDAALYTAQSYMMAKGKSINTTQKPFKAVRKAAPTTAEEQAYYYVFNAGGNAGYVIVSGDDRTEPILGYVEEGAFDAENIPDNMRSWLQLYEDQIKYIVDNDIQPGSPQLKARNRIRATKHSVPELMTTRWNQGHPYNITCPKYYKGDGTQDYPATGCTATAMAQVINFYKYPEKLKAAIPKISNTYTLDNGTTKTVTTTTIPRGKVIDWANMRDTYSWEDNHKANAQDSAVANLMYYCGQAVHMGYGPSSGANFDAKSFQTYFGFDDGCYVGERGDYSIDEWFDMLYKDISEGYPVLFSGFSSGGGHAFVLDGFDGESLFHLNWGWGGGSNGWFLVGILNPGDNSGIGASSSSDGYSMSQRALFNLRLPDNVKADPTTCLTINDLKISGTSITANYVNWTGSTNSFNVGIVRLTDEGTLTPVGATQTISSISANTYQGKSFTVNKKLSEGTYKLSPASKLTTAKTWRPKYNMRTEYIEAVVDANGVTTLTLKKPEVNIAIDTIVFPGSRIVNTEQEVKVTFDNAGDEYFKEVKFYARPEGKEYFYYTENRSIVAVRKGEKVEVSYYFNPDEVGTYDLIFTTDNESNGVVGTGTMEVVTAAKAVKANLSLSSFTISNMVSNVVYGDRIVGKAAIKNNAKIDFHGKVRFQIWNQKKGQGTAWSGSSHTANVDIAAGKIASVEFEFDNLSEDYNYYIPIYYVGQEGNITNAGLWDRSWSITKGLMAWKTTGVVTGVARKISLVGASTICGYYADCDKITRFTPNKNPNTIYAFSESMDVPASLAESNAVSGNHADRISFVNDNPFFVPVNFEADTASFHYTFPETTDGKQWKTFTMPFEADSIFVDGEPVELGNPMNHFWIYEFAAEGDDGEAIFEEAKVLRGNTPYIIAADSTMAGRTVDFRSMDIPFYKSGSDKMVVTSKSYKFQGATLAPSVRECYILNEDGTAFEYTATAKTLTGLTTYFLSNLSEEERPERILLPAVPVSEDTSIKAELQGACDNGQLVIAYRNNTNRSIGHVSFTFSLPDGITVKKSEEAFDIETAKAMAGMTCDLQYDSEAQRYTVTISGGTLDAEADSTLLAIRLEGTFTGKIAVDNIFIGDQDSRYISRPLPFDVDLIEDAIRGVAEEQSLTPLYNIAGQRIEEREKGIRIQSGKKTLIR